MTVEVTYQDLIQHHQNTWESVSLAVLGLQSHIQKLAREVQIPAISGLVRQLIVLCAKEDKYKKDTTVNSSYKIMYICNI